LPVWRGKLRAGVREAQAATASAASQSQEIANRAEAEVRAVLAGVRTQQRLLHLYTSTLLPQAEATLQAAEVAYRSGSVGFLAVLDGERQLLTLRLAEAMALGELGKAAAALGRAVGHDLTTLAMPRQQANRRQP
jgi:outer membrane protein TolC